jgi:hypothetical protein
MTASKHCRQHNEEVRHRDSGVANETQTYAVLNILDNWIYFMYAIWN